MFFPLANYLVENLSTRSNKAHYLVIDLVENTFTENKNILFLSWLQNIIDTATLTSTAAINLFYILI